LPYERRLIQTVKAASDDIVFYAHPCGAIGDRLDLMLDSGTNGINTLDPPPLGTVEFNQAVVQLKGKAFIKGNLDPSRRPVCRRSCESCWRTPRCRVVYPAGRLATNSNGKA
jgi:uroporphyrinogen-III decarboxylase